MSSSGNTKTELVGITKAGYSFLLLS